MHVFSEHESKRDRRTARYFSNACLPVVTAFPQKIERSDPDGERRGYGLAMLMNVDVAVYQQPKEGNYYCGDSYFYEQSDSEFICAIADGLGSGEYAKESSQIVIDIIRENSHADVDDLVKKINKQLLGKRGVVVGILKVNLIDKIFTYSSIGNIGVMLVKEGKKVKRNIPNSGYLAGYRRPFKEIEGEL